MTARCPFQGAAPNIVHFSGNCGDAGEKVPAESFKDTLRASFGLYRKWDSLLAQNMERAKEPLTIPVIGIGEANSWGPYAAGGIAAAAPKVETAVIPGAGHDLALTHPDAAAAAAVDFLKRLERG